MAIKTKIGVGADVEKFRESYNLFQKYQAALKEQYGVYVNQAPHIKAAAEAGAQFEKLVNLDDAVKAQGKFASGAAKARQSFADLAKGIGHFMTRSGASAINSSSGFIGSSLRLVGGEGALEGLGILGGPIGLLTASLIGVGVWIGIKAEEYTLGVLAGAVAGVSAQRRSALGLGTTYGGLAAFDLDFARFGVDQGTLANVAGGAYDITSPQYYALHSAGLSGRGDNAEVAKELIRRVPEILRGVPDAMVGKTAQTYGLTNIFSLDQLIRLRDHPEEVEKQIAAFNRDKGFLGIPKDVQEKWASFNTALEAAGRRIEAAFGNKLVPIANVLEKFSNAAVNVIDAFIKSDTVTSALKGVANSLQLFDKEIGSPEFREAAKKFLLGIEALGPYAKALAKISGLVTRGLWFTGKEIFDPNYNPSAADLAGDILGQKRPDTNVPPPHVSVGRGSYSLRYYAGHPQDRPKYGGVIDEKTGKLEPPPAFKFSPKSRPAPSADTIDYRNFREKLDSGALDAPSFGTKRNAPFVGAPYDPSPASASAYKIGAPLELPGAMPAQKVGTTLSHDDSFGLRNPALRMRGRALHVLEHMHKAPAQPIIIDNNTGANVSVGGHSGSE